MFRLSLPVGLVLAALTLTAALPASAITYAQDDASAYTTDFSATGSNNTSITQPNHGTGFNAFVFQDTGSSYAGWYLDSGQAVGTGTGQKSFGIYADLTATTTATRSFNFSLDGVTPPVVGATTPLFTGQTLNASFQNRDIAAGKTVGFSLENSAGTGLFTFDFLGGGADYRLTDSSGTTTISTLPYTSGGQNTSFLLTGANAYTFSATNIDGTGTVTHSGTFTGAIDRIVYFSNGSSDNGQVHFSALSITGPSAVPEASSSIGLGVMLALGGVGLVLNVRKRRHAVQA